MKAYFKDQSLFILLFMIHTGFIVLTAYLVIYESGAILSITNLLYICLLSFFFISCWLFLDWLRKRQSMKKLVNITKDSSNDLSSIEKILVMKTNSSESALWQETLKIQQEIYQKEIHKQASAKYHHTEFMNQWIHHMKTPVSVISLLIQQGKQGFSDQKMKDLLDDMNDENDRFRHGLDLMLQLARLDHFSVDLKSESVNLNTMLSTLINEEKKQFIRRKIYPQLQTPDDRHVIVTSDAKWLNVVFSQLLLNALKYSNQHIGDQIIFQMTREDNLTSVSIIDQGIGIEAYDLPRVFHPFFTGDNGRNRSESTGMGLYLAKKVCDGLGHQLSITSTPNQGTKVTISFRSVSLHDKTVR